MNSSRRDFLLRSGLVSLGGTGLLISACGGGGGGTGGGGTAGGGAEGLLNYGSQELPTKAYGAVPSVRSASGSITTTTNLTLPGVATIVGSKCNNISGHSLSIKASLDVAKAVTFIATVPAETTSRISYGIEVLVSSIQESGKVHVAIDLPVEMQSKDPNTIVVGAHLIFDDSEGFIALESAVSADKRTVAVDVPASVFEEASGKYLAHLVVAEMQVSRRPGTRPVDYSPNAQKLTVASETPSGFSFQSRPLDLPSPQPIEIVSRVGMREATATESYDRKPHVGVDIRTDEGTKVLSVADGYLVRLIDFSKQPTGQGNFVSIDHGDVASQYLHLASIDPGILAKIGGRPPGGVFVAGGPRLIPIKAGEVLGIAGNTSTSRIDRHLHLNLVPSGSAWKDSRGLTYVYNPEPLLGGVLDKPQLIAEFLFGYEGKKYQSHDDPNMFVGNPTDELISVIVGSDKTAYLTLHAKDSVFRDVPLPSDGVLSATCSDTNIATVSIDTGRVKIVAKKNGEVKVKVVYTASAQKSIKAYGEVKVKVIYAPLLAQYKKEMCDIKGQFKMGRTEVTVGMWREYCEIEGKQMPPDPRWGWIDSHPIVNVTWYECKAYADWAGLRLPTGTEWELAATGGDGRNYPWGGYGDERPDYSWPGWDPSKCVNSVDSEQTSTAPVGSIPSGDSPFGCSDMSGNVWEWCSNDYDRGKEVRGGSWNDDAPFDFRCAYRFGFNPDNRDFSLSIFGFRLSVGPG